MPLLFLLQFPDAMPAFKGGLDDRALVWNQSQNKGLIFCDLKLQLNFTHCFIVSKLGENSTDTLQKIQPHA